LKAKLESSLSQFSSSPASRRFQYGFQLARLCVVTYDR
jgi:hypothetical protein